jgi:hypothetical protein
MAQTPTGRSDQDSILPELALASANLPVLGDVEKAPSAKEELQEVPLETGDHAIPLQPIHHQFPKLSRFRKIAIPLLCMSGTFQQASAAVGISLGIREIGNTLNIPEYQLQWLQSSMSLAYACTLLLFGRCADIWGHKIFFVGGLLMAGVFNIATGLSQSSIQMFVFRALTGAMFAW